MWCCLIDCCKVFWFMLCQTTLFVCYLLFFLCYILNSRYNIIHKDIAWLFIDSWLILLPDISVIHFCLWLHVLENRSRLFVRKKKKEVCLHSLTITLCSVSVLGISDTLLVHYTKTTKTTKKTAHIPHTETDTAHTSNGLTGHVYMLEYVLDILCLQLCVGTNDRRSVFSVFSCLCAS